MKEKFKKIEFKDELYAEIAVSLKKAIGTVETHWFGKNFKIPDKYLSSVEAIIDKRIKYESLVKRSNKKIHQNIFGY